MLKQSYFLAAALIVLGFTMQSRTAEASQQVVYYGSNGESSGWTLPTTNYPVHENNYPVSQNSPSEPQASAHASAQSRWSGFYAGGNVGFAQGTDDYSVANFIGFLGSDNVLNPSGP